MVNPTARPRCGRVLLWVSGVLFTIFLAFSVCIWHATRIWFIPNAELLAELKDAEFLEELPPSPGSGWPQWRGVNRDGVASAESLLTKWPTGGPRGLWPNDITDLEGYSNVAVVGDRAFTMGRKDDEEVIRCFRPDTGETVWQESHDPRFDVEGEKSFDPATKQKGLEYGNGPRSTPTLNDDRLYTVGATGWLQCRQAQDGKLIWQHNLLAEYGAPNLKWGTACSPLIDGDLVFVNPGGPNGKSLAALDKKTGITVWTSQNDPASYSSPVAITVDGERQIVFLTGTRLVGVKAQDGRLRWQFDWPAPVDVNAATPVPFRTRTAGKERQYVFITSGYRKGCALIAILGNGAGDCQATSVFTSNYLCSHYGSPVRVGDHIYGFNEEKLVCMSLRTGKVAWEKKGYGQGNILAVRTHLLVLGADGILALLKASAEPDGPTVVAEAPRVMSRKCWTMPVLVDGRLFLRDQEKIRCLDLRKK